jgi:large subunit ribosomal protein L29
MSKASALREQSDDQLHLTLSETQHQLFRLRLQSETERLEAPSEIIKAKREVARLKTVLRERQLTREQKAESAASTAVGNSKSPAPTQTQKIKKSAKS